jgi:ring-1,2-phenylacetyl-CoA epoxidase subunit PaaE
MVFHKLAISSIRKTTADSVEIGFYVPGNIKSAFRYEPGQYLTLKTNIDGEEVRRAYSISSVPTEQKITVVIKKVHDGKFSTHAMTLAEGDELEVAPPEGLFVHKPQKVAADYLLVAAGSGITPIMSMLRSILNDEPEARVLLLYGNRSVSDTIYHQEILQLVDSFKDRFTYKTCFSREDLEDSPFGRMATSTFNFLLNQWKKEQEVEDSFAFAKAYLCGPKPMIDEISEVIEEKQLAQKEDISFELFQNEDAEVEIEEDSTISEITVILDDEEHTLTMRRDEVILDAILDQGLDAPYSCQGGICSSCVGLIEEGSTSMRKNSILTDGEIEDGLTLTCQAQPTSAKVKVNYDEV